MKSYARLAHLTLYRGIALPSSQKYYIDHVNFNLIRQLYMLLLHGMRALHRARQVQLKSTFFITRHHVHFVNLVNIFRIASAHNLDFITVKIVNSSTNECLKYLKRNGLVYIYSLFFNIIELCSLLVYVV